MSDEFKEALQKAQNLSPQEQLALVATLSQLLSQQQLNELTFEEPLPEYAEKEVLKRVKRYEEGQDVGISGPSFREELRKKYGS
ncbi:MAG: hypothetical protein AAF388_08495 [Bacteroidota bacterium]